MTPKPKGMTVKELIDHLKIFNPDLPVWFTISDDSEICYQKLTKDYVTIEEVEIYSDAKNIENRHILSLVIGNKWFLP